MVSDAGTATPAASWTPQRGDAVRDDPLIHQRARGVVQQHAAVAPGRPPAAATARAIAASATRVESGRVAPPSMTAVTLR